MSLDLYEQESQDRISRLQPITAPEVGAFDGFIRGVGLHTMRGLARTGSAIDLLGSIGPIAKDAITGGTELQDRYFKEHDDVWGSAVDYWTPKPNEVGVAGQVVGDLVSMLPQIIASPGLAVGSAIMGTSEELVQKGVEAHKALGVGAVQGAGLGLGIWMPILGQNLWQRVVLGGAGFNVVQGVTSRAASGAILEGTPATDEFKAFDGQALTLDVLLGAAFGAITHLSPKQREQGQQYWERLTNWASELPPSDKAAIATLRLAQHLNVDSAPGVPASTGDIESHVNRVRTALEQLQRGEHVEVSDLPEPIFEPDAARAKEATQRADELVKQAERARKSEGLPEVPEISTREPAPPPLAPESEAPAAKPGETVPPPPRGPRGAEAAGAEGLTPESVKAALQERRFAFLPRQVENMKYNIARIEEEIPALEADAARKVGKGDKVGAETKRNAADVLKRKQASLEEQRAELADAQDMISTGRRPEVPDWEVEFAIEGMSKDAAKAAAADKSTEATPDPVSLQADRIATERPDMRIRVGTDAEGNPIVKTAKEYLDEARAAAKRTRGDANLYEAAAQCLLGGG